MSERVVICAKRATVVRDDRSPTRRVLTGCVVGKPEEHTDRTYLVGWSFVTEVMHADEIARWPRSEAPSPCPHCGAADA